MADEIVIDIESLVAGVSRLVDIRPIMTEAAAVLARSVEKNFQLGGRYSMGPGGPEGGEQIWAPLKRERKSSGGRDAKGRYRKRGSGRVLQDSGALAASVDARADGLSVILSSHLAYAAIHHYGGVVSHPGGTPYIMGKDGMATFIRKDGKYPPGTRFTAPHPIPIPARPFLVVQQEDLEEIVQMLADYSHYI